VHASYLETCLRETIDAPSWDRELKKRDQQRQLEASWRVLLRRTGQPPLEAEHASSSSNQRSRGHVLLRWTRRYSVVFTVVVAPRLHAAP